MNRKTIVILSLSVLVLLLAGFAVYEMAQLKQAETVNRANDLAADSVSLRDSRFDLSLLLSVEAYRRADTVQTKGALLDSVQANPNLVKYWHLPGCTFDNLAVSPDGSMFATGCYAEKIILVDRSNQKLIREFNIKPDKPEMGHINQLVFSSDGRYLIADIFRKSYPNRFLSIWDVSSGKPVNHPELESLSAESFAFSPDGKKMVICEWGKASIWDMPTLTLEGRFEIGLFLGLGGRNAYPQVLSLVFSPDSKTLAGISSVNQVTFWDVATREKIGKPFQIGEEYSQNGVEKIAFYKDAKTLLAMYADGSLIAWQVETHNQIYKTQPLLTREQYLLSQSGNIIAPEINLMAVRDGSSIRILDIQTGHEITRLTGNANQVSWMDFTPDGTSFLTGNSSQFSFWNFSNSSKLIQKSIENKGSTFTLSPDEKLLAFDDFGLVRIFDFQQNSVVKELGIGEDRAGRPIAFSPDSKLLAAGNSKGITLWNLEAGKPEGEPFITVVDEIHSPAADGVVFSHDGKTLVFDGGGSIHFWDISSHNKIAEDIPGGFSYGQVPAVTPDEKLIAVREYVNSVSDGINNVVLVDMKTKQKVGLPMEHSSYVRLMVFSPDGKTLATSDDRFIRFWDVTTQKLIGNPIPRIFGELPEALAYSPDGKTLAIGTYLNSVKFMDVKSRQFLGHGIQSIDWPADNVIYTRDGKTLLVSSNKIDLLDVDPQSWEEKICQRVGRNFTRMEWDYFLPDDPYRATCPQWPVDEIKTEPTATDISN
jgi:WD40 repeat protein